MYSYLLSALPESTRPDKSLQHSTWTILQDLPLYLYDSTPAILAGRLVCVGGDKERCVVHEMTPYITWWMGSG